MNVEFVRSIIDPLYLVGGSVRDELLGHEPVDYNFGTPLTQTKWESVLEMQGGVRT